MSRLSGLTAEHRDIGWISALRADSWQTSIGLALILLTTFVAYLPAVHGDRLWDDDAHITKPELQSLNGLYRIWFELGATQQYYPLLHSAFWLEHKLWGDSVLGYHLVNVLLHSTSVVLLFLILRRLNIPGALLAAAIFAVHPVMVESVAWITEQKNTLSGVFYLSSMLAYLHYDDSRKASQYFLAMALFLLGLLTKTVIATLPAALLVIFWWQRGALSWKREILPLLPFFMLGAAAGVATAWIERTQIGAQGADFNLSVLQRVLIAGRVVWFYMAKLIWPANLIFIYPRWNIDPAELWQWFFPIATLGTTIALWLMRKRTRAPLAGWLLFVGTLFPVLGFLNVFPFLFSFVADHFQYLASLGLIVLFASSIMLAIAHSSATMRRAVHAVCVLLIFLLAVTTWRQCRTYADAFRLYQTTIDRNPECWMAQLNLGKALEDTGDLQNAIACYRSALKLRPNYPQALNNLGYAFILQGRAAEGISYIEQAIQLWPDYTQARLNATLALRQLGKNEEAIVRLRELVKQEPKNAEVHGSLSSALDHIGKAEEAIDEDKIALALKPDDPFLLNNLGIALLHSRRPAEAIEALEKAVRLNPNYAQAHNSFGLALASIGKKPRAIEEFNRAIQLSPNYAKAHFNLASVLASDGKMEEAIEHYQAALRTKPDDMPAYANLAQTLALANRPGEALAVSEKAIEAARKTGQKDAERQFEEWLKNNRAQLQRAAEAESRSQTLPKSQ
jgi:protein O-mannosyl-transferase